ncbi:hypothetical protein ACFWGN_11875 [Oerskovia sp. NPDC060338]|uniref:hypothetical protein n=1 Tax=Oerskovia sp. NPDC060338 TaxID=3347100 RepID=UPI00364EA04B
MSTDTDTTETVELSTVAAKPRRRTRTFIAIGVAATLIAGGFTITQVAGAREAAAVELAQAEKTYDELASVASAQVRTAERFGVDTSAVTKLLEQGSSLDATAEFRAAITALTAARSALATEIGLARVEASALAEAVAAHQGAKAELDALIASAQGALDGAPNAEAGLRDALAAGITAASQASAVEVAGVSTDVGAQSAAIVAARDALAPLVEPVTASQGAWQAAEDQRVAAEQAAAAEQEAARQRAAASTGGSTAKSGTSTKSGTTGGSTAKSGGSGTKSGTSGGTSSGSGSGTKKPTVPVTPPKGGGSTGGGSSGGGGDISVDTCFGGGGSGDSNQC